MVEVFLLVSVFFIVWYKVKFFVEDFNDFDDLWLLEILWRKEED